MDPVQEAKALVQALHAPGNSAHAPRIQERLLSLQKTDAGWTIADGLLSSDDKTERFFGALTLTIRIHQDWEALNDDSRRGLLAQLMTCFVSLANARESMFVMRKVMSTLSTFFFKPKSPWNYVLRHTALCIASGQYIPEEECSEEAFAMALPSLSGEKLLLLLALSTTLAEDSASVSGTTEIDARNRLGLNVKDAILLDEFTLNTVLSREGDAKFGDADQLADAAGEAIKSLSAWISVSRNTKPAAVDLRAILAIPLNCVVRFLAVDGVALSSMELLTDILTNHPSLLSQDQVSGVLSFLSGPPGEKYAVSLLQGEYEDENMNFLELLLAYASMGSQELLMKPLDMQTERVVFLLHTLFRVPGFAEVDEKVSTLLLEFWTNAADDLRDTLMEGDIDIVPDQAKMELAQAINNCYPKLCYPDPTTHRWDEDERRNFAGFRRDYADFLMGAYPLLGSGLIKQFQERASAALASNDWGNFEVAISCLAFLSDAVADLEEMDPIFHSIFLSPAFEEMCFNRVMLPKRTRQTLADMIARYTTYFERNPATIPRTLNLLFNSLELPNCDRIASKSISVLCQSCRKALVVYVEEFINKFNALRSRPSVNLMTLERVAEGIAAIITAVPSDIGKVNSLTSLLEPFEQVAKIAQQQWQQGQAEEALASALQAIRCTASIGKGYRDQDDGPISLDDDEDKSHAADFWGVNGPGGAPQACIMRILNILVNTFSFDGEVIEAACDVLRAGYTESKPGPYVLPPQVTVDFVKASAVVTSPRFSTIMATATSFLASHALHPVQKGIGAMEFILHIYELIQYMNSSTDLYDPEVAHSCIDLLDHLLRKTSSVFFNLAESRADGLAMIAVILDFIINCLNKPDPLPLRAASSFWTTLLSIPDPPPAFQPSPPMRLQGGSLPSSFFDQCLASLSTVLIHQISGNCARSDLERLSDIIRKFVFKYQGAAKLHLGNALAVVNADSMMSGPGSHLATATSGEQVDAVKGPSKADKDRFLSIIIASRGSRATTTEVKAFWITCRGRGFAYAS